MIAPGFVQELLARTDIVEVVGRQVELKKAGINYKGLCPFHGEKTPSFSVSPSRQTYHCFGCGAHGDAIRFLTECHGLSFVDAVHDLAQAAGLAVPEDQTSPGQRAQAVRERQHQATLADVLERAAEHYRCQLKTSEHAVAYLKKRGLTGRIAARFGIGYAPAGWRSLAGVFPHYDDLLLAESGLVIVQGDDGAEHKRYDRFRDRIMFPIRNVKGQTIGFGGRVLGADEPKYLNSPETPVFIKGQELYGLFEARGALRERGYALVCEGYMDVVALAQHGFANAVATLGTACTAEHVHKLLRFTDQVVFSFDGDAAGRRAAGRALQAALPHASDVRSFRFLFLPPEHDPDSFIRELGADAFEQRVRAAVPLSRQLLDDAAQECDLATAEGRARMLAQARPLWAALPEGSLRLQLLNDLARQGALPVAELAALWQTQLAQIARLARQQARQPPAQASAQHDTHHPNGVMTAAPPWRGRRDDAVLWALSRRTPRQPQDIVVQLLFGEPSWWDTLTPAEHALLHALPAPHGPAIAWLERDLAEHGPRPWAVVAPALRADTTLPEASRRLADGDAHPDARPEHLRVALDHLLLRELSARKQTLMERAAHDPAAAQEYRAADEEWRAVRARQSALQREPGES